MTLLDEKFAKGEQLRANVQRLEAERQLLMKEALETKTTPPELAIKTTEYMAAYAELQKYDKDDLSPYSDR
ncbi:hypothetical protein GL264_11320 [Aeromonas jandaei]|uniref:hypothetical protein n=1 Tax=Aeromonas jandaei TaxID=650 RepID=UPI001C5A9A4C|nr:hypothetical protein [Aeromonas jandaei]MBW3761388.1 hypothetical protein [Aeromonas jandaei]